MEGAQTGVRPGARPRSDELCARAVAALGRGLPQRARDLADIGLNGHPPAAATAALLRLRAAAELAVGRAADAHLTARRALALALDGADAQALALAAEAAAALGRHEEAADGYERAIALDPLSAGWHAGLAAACLELHEHERAGAAADAALRRDAGEVTALLVLGRLALVDGRPADAAAWLGEAAARAPARADVRATLGVALAAAGDIEAGLRAYEARHLLPGWSPRPFNIPAWTGGPLAGRRLLVWSEQGLGDSLQFARFAAGARERGARVIFHGEPRLVRLLRSCAGFDEVHSLHAPRPAADLHASLVSLPALLGAPAATFAAMVPYIGAEPDLSQRWRQRLMREGGGRPIVGLAWQGNPGFCDDQRRSMVLAYLLPLVRAFSGRVRFVSLQKGFGQDQLHLLPPDLSIDDLGAELDGGGDAFVDTAAALGAFDLLLTTDTAIAHLAGALGRPVWTLLARVPDWRWGVSGTTTPWYPHMRLVRQARAGGWPGVVTDVARTLDAWVPALG